MRARVKGTEEWTDFTAVFDRDGLLGFVETPQYESRDKNYKLYPFPLSMMVFPEDVQEDNFPKIDWEQRRYEIAKSAMPFFQQVYKDNFRLIAEYAVRLADVIIAELKTKGE